MLIFSIDSYTAEHGLEVKNIITEAIQEINEPKFIVSLVSDADDLGVTQKRIVQNLYSSHIVLVMLMIGLRLHQIHFSSIFKRDCPI
jgi:hypothetical protein